MQCIDEQTLDRLAEEVYRRLSRKKLRVKRIGSMPPMELDAEFVKDSSFDVLFLGILSPGELLTMPSEPVCHALLNGIPVYLWKEQPYRNAKFAGALRRELAAAQERLVQLGVRPVGGNSGWTTTETVRSDRELCIHPPKGIRMTPLARDIWEEQHGSCNGDREFLGNKEM